jgi:hypothetical protein
MESCNIEAVRIFYVTFRLTHSLPPVQHTRMSERIRVCCVKDTDFERMYEDVTNAWEAKSLCLQAYLESKGA